MDAIPHQNVRRRAMQVHVFSSKREASEVAAGAGRSDPARGDRGRGRARMVVSTGNSQLDFIDAPGCGYGSRLDRRRRRSTWTSMPAWRRRTRRVSGCG
jgi:hypothetical protein